MMTRDIIVTTRDAAWITIAIELPTPNRAERNVLLYMKTPRNAERTPGPPQVMMYECSNALNEPAVMSAMQMKMMSHCIGMTMLRNVRKELAPSMVLLW